MFAAAADVSGFHQKVLSEAVLDVRVPHLVFGSLPGREDRGDALTDQSIGIRYQASHKRIGQSSPGDGRRRRRRRLAEVDIRGGLGPASKIARARTDTAAARSIEKNLTGAEDRCRIVQTCR